MTEKQLHFRKLWHPPQLEVDWNKLDNERKPSWLELFYDLIFVAASTKISEIFVEDLSATGFLYFFLYWTLFWFFWFRMNTYQTRFSSDSLILQVVLFLDMFGLLLMLHNISEGTGGHRIFAVGMLVSMFSFFILYGFIFLFIQKARPLASLFLIWNAISFLSIFITLFVENMAAIFILWILFPITEVFASFSGMLLLKHSVRLPLNLSHTSERHGLLVMISLGEPIISIALNPIGNTLIDLYIGLGIAFCFIFCLYLIYYNVHPPQELHAIRRSRLSAVIFNYSHWLLTTFILVLGVGLKLIIGSVDSKLEIDPSWILCGGLTASLVMISIIRKSHFWGRSELSIHVPFLVRGLWWGLIWFFSLFPILFGFITSKLSPITLLLLLTLLSAIFVILETVLTHYLEARRSRGTETIKDSINSEDTITKTIESNQINKIDNSSEGEEINYSNNGNFDEVEEHSQGNHTSEDPTDNEYE